MKINIRLSVVIVAMLSATVVSAQKPRKLTDTQRRQFEKEFIAKSKEIASLQCGFTQTKTSVLVAGSAVSKGNMYYSSPSMLAWEYVAPIKSVLVVNGKQTQLLDNNGKSVGNSQAIKQLGSLIINMINGNERSTFTTLSISWCSTGLGIKFSSAVIHSNTPSGAPSINENNVEKNTIISVCAVAVPTSCNNVDHELICASPLL